MPTSTHSDTRIDSIDERQKKRSVKFTLRFDKTVQNVGSRERMLGLANFARILLIFARC